MQPNRTPIRRKARRNQSPADAWKLGSGDELETALQAAERLLDQAEERHRHEQNRNFAILSILVGAVFSFLASLVFLFQVSLFDGASSMVAAATSLLAAVVFYSSMLSWVKQRKRMSTDHTLRLATQLSNMIGEALVEISEREQWSYIRLESTKLRLASFPLPEPTRNKV